MASGTVSFPHIQTHNKKTIRSSIYLELGDLNKDSRLNSPEYSKKISHTVQSRVTVFTNTPTGHANLSD